MENTFEQLYGLTEAQRIDARNVARQNIVARQGAEPQRHEFEHHAANEWPTWVSRLVIGFAGVLLVAAALVSYFRITAAGRQHYLETLGGSTRADVVGLAAFIMAEAMVIVSASMRAHVPEGKKWVTTITTLLGLAMAFVGNAVITRPELAWSWAAAWGILETFTPPIAVLVVALLLEGTLASAVQRRHANEVAYQQARAAWLDATRAPEDDLAWRGVYASALRTALLNANTAQGTGRGLSARRDIVRGMTDDDWRRLVWREMNANQWFEGGDGVPPRGTDGTLANAPVRGDFVPPRADLHQSDPIDRVVGHLGRCSQDAELSVRDLAAKLDVSRSTAHRAKKEYSNGRQQEDR